MLRAGVLCAGWVPSQAFDSGRTGFRRGSVVCVLELITLTLCHSLSLTHSPSLRPQAGAGVSQLRADVLESRVVAAGDQSQAETASSDDGAGADKTPGEQQAEGQTDGASESEGGNGDQDQAQAY